MLHVLSLQTASLHWVCFSEVQGTTRFCMLRLMSCPFMLQVHQVHTLEADQHRGGSCCREEPAGQHRVRPCCCQKLVWLTTVSSALHRWTALAEAMQLPPASAVIRLESSYKSNLEGRGPSFLNRCRVPFTA